MAGGLAFEKGGKELEEWEAEGRRTGWKGLAGWLKSSTWESRKYALNRLQMLRGTWSPGGLRGPTSSSQWLVSDAWDPPCRKDLPLPGRTECHSPAVATYLPSVFQQPGTCSPFSVLTAPSLPLGIPIPLLVHTLQKELTPLPGSQIPCDSGLANQSACMPPATLISQG